MEVQPAETQKPAANGAKASAGKTAESVLPTYELKALEGEKTLEELGQEMFDLVIAVCEGKTVKAEENGCLEMAINQFYSYA